MPLRILALIPARSGSIGLKDKNIRKLHGVPLLTRAVHLARSAPRRGEAWRVVVSTDSERYARLARRAGAEVPFLRPRRLATARSRLIDAVIHAVDRLESEGDAIDAIVLLSATTPLTTARDVRAAVSMFKKGRGTSVASVALDPAPVTWRFGMARGKLTARGPVRIDRRQTDPTPYRLNGAVYVATPAWLRRHRQVVVPGKTLGLVMPRHRSLDIEDVLDLALAEFMLKSPVLTRSKRFH